MDRHPPSSQTGIDRSQSPGLSGQPDSGDPASQALRCLAESPYAALKELACVHRDGTLVLTGRVPTFYLKQLAQETARNGGDIPVINQVEVSAPRRLPAGRP